jgi:hypothetical protein
VEEPRDTGGQFKQDLLMKHQLISSGVQNAETPGEDQIKINRFLIYKNLIK